jgi:hypothetical protein
VPTGIKIGVLTVPWGSSKLPQRAELFGSVARIEKDTGKSDVSQKALIAKLNQLIPKK